MSGKPGAPFALELDNVRKSFGKTEIIRGANIQVKAGERVAVIGPEGVLHAPKMVRHHLFRRLVVGRQFDRRVNHEAAAPRRIARGIGGQASEEAPDLADSGARPFQPFEP